VTGSDIVLHVGMLHRSKVEQVCDAVSPLVNMTWLTPEGDDERWARAWEVNPAIYTQFAERAAKARADATMTRRLIASSLGGGKAGEDREKFYDFYCARDTKGCDPPNLDKEEVSPRARNKTHKSPG